MNTDPAKHAKRAIKALGGPAEVAARLWNDRTKQNVVQNWRVRGVPGVYAPAIAEWSGIKLAMLCPRMVRS